MTEDRTRLYLSKSLYIKGLQCPKSLWLDRYRPEVRDEISASQERVFNNGIAVGRLARSLFPCGIEIPHEGSTYEEKVQVTAALIGEGVTTLYEASFSFDDLFIKADILHLGKGGWDLYEVKGTTQVKDIHLDDVALQYYVIAGSGLPINRAFLVHVNNEYVRRGEVDVHQLFTIEEITGLVREKQTDVRDAIGALRRMLQGAEPSLTPFGLALGTD